MRRTDNPNLPLGGHTSYGPSQREFTPAEQRLAIVERYGAPLELYDCGICGAFHPNGFHGDCRMDLFRVADPDELFGATGWAAIEMESAR
jgi:hypothetical protein